MIYLHHCIGSSMKVSIGKYKKNGKDRNVKVEVSEDDCICLDTTLALIIHPCLVEFRSKCFGYPAELEELEQFHAILDKMIWSFKEIAYEDAPNPQNAEEFDDYYARLDEGLQLFSEYYRSLWL